MIQDINEKYNLDYVNCNPNDGDYILAYGKNIVVLEKNEIIRYNSLCTRKLVYGFSIGKKKFFIDTNNYNEGEPIEIFRRYPDKEMRFAIVTGYHLFNWYNKNRYCGACGNKFISDTKLRRLYCSCGNEAFPNICPAVIVGIIKDDKILLTKYRIGYRDYALVAGYTEIGETFEDTIRREVFEEVHLHVSDIRYYKSQPWGLSGSVLAGYFAKACDDDIELEVDELKEAKWFTKDEITLVDDEVSLTREMILYFKNGGVSFDH